MVIRNRRTMPGCTRMRRQAILMFRVISWPAEVALSTRGFRARGLASEFPLALLRVMVSHVGGRNSRPLRFGPSSFRAIR